MMGGMKLKTASKEQFCKVCGTYLKWVRPEKPGYTGLCQECLNEKRSKEAFRCLDCGVRVTRRDTRCMDCHLKMVEVKRNYCPDCGIRIQQASKRCRKCHHKRRAKRKPNCKDCGIKLKQQNTKRCRKCWLSYLSQVGMPQRMAEARATALRNGKISKAEMQCRELLDMFGVSWETQIPFGRWIVDFFLEDHGLIVEVHGAYWHDRPKSIERDQRKREYLEGKGYRVLFLKTDKTHLWPFQIWQILGWLPSKKELKGMCTTSR